MKLLIRPEHVELLGRGPGGAMAPEQNQAPGVVRTTSFIGKIRIVDVEVAGQLVRCELVAADPVEIGSSVRVLFPAERCVLVSAEGPPASHEELAETASPPPDPTSDQGREVLAADRV